MKILVVDDEKHIRESLKRILELEGMEADSAEDGPSAQKLFLDTVYDAVNNGPAHARNGRTSGSGLDEPGKEF